MGIGSTSQTAVALETLSPDPQAEFCTHLDHFVERTLSSGGTRSTGRSASSCSRSGSPPPAVGGTAAADAEATVAVVAPDWARPRPTGTGSDIRRRHAATWRRCPDHSHAPQGRNRPRERARQEGTPMGKGGFIKIHNDGNEAIKILVTDLKCMYDAGESGSNPSIFNDATIAGNSSWNNGSSEYIEAKNSGDCHGITSLFTFKIFRNSNHLGDIHFYEGNDRYQAKDAPKNIGVDIKPGEQDHITITVL